MSKQPLKVNIPTTAAEPETTPLSKKPTSPSSAQSDHSAVDRERAMSTTGAWQPNLNRRQSWSPQEYKHEMQKPLQTGQAPGSGSGFTERK